MFNIIDVNKKDDKDNIYIIDKNIDSDEFCIKPQIWDICHFETNYKVNENFIVKSYKVDNYNQIFFQINKETGYGRNKGNEGWHTINLGWCEESDSITKKFRRVDLIKLIGKICNPKDFEDELRNYNMIITDDIKQIKKTVDFIKEELVCLKDLINQIIKTNEG